MTDLLIYGGAIETVDDEYKNPEAVVVRDKKVFFVGNLEEAHALIRPESYIHNLAGATLLPGFIDAHSHPLLSAQLRGAPVIDIKPEVVPTFEAVIAKIERRVAYAKPGEYLLFFGLDAQFHDGLEIPTRDSLDKLAPDNPIAIQTSNLHALYLNSAALDACGISAERPTPIGGIIERDEKGRPTGMIAESTLFVALNTFHEAWGDARLVNEFKSFIQPFIENGITTTTDHLYQPFYKPYYKRALDQGWAIPRIAAYHQVTVSGMNIENVNLEDDRFWMAGIKIHADGSPFVGNIWVSEPYLENEITLQKMDLRPGHTGGMNYPIQHFRDMVRSYASKGWQVSVHAQGDRTIDAVLDIYEEVLSESKGYDHRFRLEHCALMRKDQIEKAVSLGVLSSFFINHLTYWGGPIEDVLFGPDRAAKYMPAKSAVRAGMRISLHADTPMTEPSALALMQAAITRETEDGKCLGPEECLDTEAALKAVTIDAAYQLKKDDVLGSITPGKHADFVILSDNPLFYYPHDLRDIEVKETIIGGKSVWRKNG